MTEKSLVLNEPRRYKAPIMQLDVSFQRYVGNRLGIPELVETPRFLTPEGGVSAQWANGARAHRTILREHTRSVQESERMQQDIAVPLYASPGAIKFKEKTNRWEAVDPNSPIGQVQQIQQEAQNVLDDFANFGFLGVKNSSVILRRRLIDVFNGYAGESFSEATPLSYSSLGNISLETIAGRSLYHWREILVKTKKRAETVHLWHTHSPEVSIKEYKALRDSFLNILFKRLSGAEPFPPAVHFFKQLLDIEDYRGFIEIANLFFKGNMGETYVELSKIAERHGESLPAHWKNFKGTAGEFARRHITETDNGVSQ